jgi:hypothetical protein
VVGPEQARFSDGAKLMSLWARLRARWRQERDSHQRVFASVGRLRPGAYLRSGPTVWHHWKVAVPEHLRRTKVRAPPGVPRSHRFSSFLSRRCLPLLYRPVTRATGGGDHGYPIAVAAGHGDVLFIDPRAGHVGRLLGNNRVDHEQLRLRTLWSRHVPSPGFTMTSDGVWMEEDYIPGRAIRDVDHDESVAVMRRLMSSYRDLARKHSSGDSAAFVSQVSLLTPQFLRIPGFALLQEDDIQDWLRQVPVLPTPVDQATGNIVVSEANEPVLIDAFPMAMLPAYYTPVSLMTSRVSLRALRRDYFEGVFDRELGTLFTAADSTYGQDMRSRQALVAMSLLIHAVARAANAGTDRPAEDFLRDSLRGAGLDQPAEWPSLPAAEPP